MAIAGLGGVTLTQEAEATLARLRAEEAARAAQAQAKAPKAADNLGKDTFLKLLVAQLKYQDPMKPSDPTAFMTQTAQFSMVERLTAMEEATAQLLAAQRGQSATALLGTQISWTEGDTKKTGVVTGLRMGPEGPTLEVGDKDVPYALVTRVATPPAAPATPPPAETD